MTRDDWIRAFIGELVRLRPHLQPAYGGTSKLLLAQAAQAYSPSMNPVTAAREAHARMAQPPA